MTNCGISVELNASVQLVRQVFDAAVDEGGGFLLVEARGDDLAGGGDGRVGRHRADLGHGCGFSARDTVPRHALAALDQRLQLYLGIPGEALGFFLRLGQDRLCLGLGVAGALGVANENGLSFFTELLGLGQLVLDGHRAGIQHLREHRGHALPQD